MSDEGCGLRDVICDQEEPADPPGERLKGAVAFLCPEGGGREWLVPPAEVTQVVRL
ncbi:hypothetical protein GCM10022244_17080 [Streptomyces gulbargensis]|uniref:Uncharacterized protein n=1 Tax=Streptomyces gulbargensis TaxID=364901 RepID=A0ABP7LUF9_9ACTN